MFYIKILFVVYAKIPDTFIPKYKELDFLAFKPLRYYAERFHEISKDLRIGALQYNPVKSDSQGTEKIGPSYLNFVLSQTSAYLVRLNGNIRKKM